MSVRTSVQINEINIYTSSQSNRNHVSHVVNIHRRMLTDSCQERRRMASVSKGALLRQEDSHTQTILTESKQSSLYNTLYTILNNYTVKQNSTFLGTKVIRLLKTRVENHVTYLKPYG